MGEKIWLWINYYLISQVNHLILILYLPFSFLLLVIETLTKFPVLLSAFLRLWCFPTLCGLLNKFNCFALVCDSSESTESQIISPVESSEILWSLHGLWPILLAFEILYNLLSSFGILFDWTLCQFFPFLSFQVIQLSCLNLFDHLRYFVVLMILFWRWILIDISLATVYLFTFIDHLFLWVLGLIFHGQ